MNNVKCGNCGHSNPATNKFCGGCGKPLLQTTQVTQYEYLNFGWRAEKGQAYDQVLARQGLNHDNGQALTEPQARIHFWQRHQQHIQNELQPYLNDDWQPITEVGPGCIEIVPSYELEIPSLKRVLKTFYIHWCFVGVQIKLQRSKK